MPDDLHTLSATEAVSLFRSRALSPVELTRAVIAQAERTEPVVNALSYRMFEKAEAQAKTAEARYVGEGPAPRPLEGLTVAIKDSGHIEGLPTSFGSLTADETPQPETSAVNARVLEAGGIVHARSATPEFSCATFTHSRKWGVTRNPWNPAFTPGGSSGGAGAALAAGSTTLATGSDIGGSIRIPASCCGVVGFKPSRGRNPVDPPFNFDHYCHTGPMARTVGDTMLLQNVMCGPHPSDPTTLSPALSLTREVRGVRGMKIAWSLDLGFYEVDEDVARNTKAALDVFADLGAELTEVDLPWTWDINDAVMTHLESVFGASIAPMLDDAPHLITGYARQFAENSKKTSSNAYYTALTRAGEAGREFGKVMACVDLFLCPTTALPAVRADFDHSRDALTLNGKSVPPMLGWVMTPVFNMLSMHPVLSVPSGPSKNGVPTGIQIVGRPFGDQEVFRAGFAYEAARPELFGRIAPVPRDPGQTKRSPAAKPSQIHPVGAG